MCVLRVIEKQRSALTNSEVRLEVDLGEYSLLLLQEQQGLGLSTYPCHLCDASRDDMRNIQLIKQGFPINRTQEKMMIAGETARINPGRLTKSQLAPILKGSKATPLSSSLKSVAENSFEPLHFKLSLARWLRGIMIRVNAGLFTWNIDQTLKPIFKMQEYELDKGLQRVLGIQTRMQIQGNEASKILSSHSIEELLMLITDKDQQSKMKILLTEMSYLNTVIQSMQPKENHSLAEFQQRAIQVQEFLVTEMEWVHFPDYLHIGLCHTVEILEQKDSIGKFSAQSKEGKNKLVRRDAKSVKISSIAIFSPKK